MSSAEYYGRTGNVPNADLAHPEPNDGDRFFRTAHREFTGANIITASCWLEIDGAGEKWRRSGFKIRDDGGTMMKWWGGTKPSPNGTEAPFLTVQMFGGSEVSTFADALEWIGQTLRRFQDTAERPDAAKGG